MSKTATKFICTLLSLIMLLCAMPMSVIAEALSTGLKTDASGAYLIGTADELFAFAELAKSTAEADKSAGSARTALSAKLTADINLNPGVTFTYDHATGLVTAAKGDKSCKMGTGMKGTELGNFHPIYNGLCTEEEWNAPAETEEEREELERKRAEWVRQMEEKVAELGLRAWTPIGTAGIPYVGYFDGNGHTIDGLYINDNTVSGAGLFGVMGNDTYISGIDDYGELKDLTIGENSLVVGYNVNSYGYGSTGAFVGRTKSAGITACVNRATVVGKGSVSPGSASAGLVGGIAGYVNGKVRSCVNYGTVVSFESAGGVVGNVMGSIYDRGTLLYCRNYGKVYADTESTGGYAGGIAVNAGGTVNAYDYAGEIDGCVNYGYVEGCRAGGILWRGGRGVQVQYSANHGKVAATGFAAGIVENIGRDSFTMKGCYNAGNVEVLTVSGDATEPSGSAYPLASTIYTYSTDGKPTNHTIQDCYNDKTVCPAEDDALFGAKITATDCFSVTKDFFATGEPAYEMGSYDSRGWRQKLPSSAEGGEIYPTTEGSNRVYERTRYCCHTDETNRKAHKSVFYSNEYGNITDAHTPNEAGICSHCGIDVRLPVFTPDTLIEAKVGKRYDVDIRLDESLPMANGYIKAIISDTDDTAYTFSHGLTGTADYSYYKKYYYTISGIPTETGTLTFTLVAENGNGVTKKTYTLKIIEADPLEISTEAKLDNGTVGESYWRTLQCFSTDFEKTWSIAEGSALPDGLTLTKDGTISGKPTTPGDYTFTIVLTAGSQTVQKTFTLRVFEEGGCKHVDMVKCPGTPASCQKDGRADYYHCNDCEHDFSDMAGENELWNKDNLKTAATHTDKNSDGKCDFCGKNMPVFRKVTNNDGIVYGGTYIFVAKIGGKLYALTIPQEGEYYRDYGDFMVLCEVTPDANGDLTFNALEAANAIMLKTGFAVENGNLDAGMPRYGISTILDNLRYGLSDGGPCFEMYPNEPAKYGYRITINDAGEAQIGSVYQSWWSTPETADNGLLRAFDMTYGGNNTKMMSFFTAKEYNGEGMKYSGAAMTEYPIYLYRMTDVGQTKNGVTFATNDNNSNVSKGSFGDGLPDIMDISNVNGISEAVKEDYIAAIADSAATGGTTSVIAGVCADIEAIGYTEGASLKYSVTLKITITDRSGNVLYQGTISDSALNGAPITVTLYAGNIVPAQIVHYKEDGTKEYFYSRWSSEANAGAKTFEYENGYVTFTVDSFSDIELLAKAVPEEEDVAVRTIGIDKSGFTVSGNTVMVIYDRACRLGYLDGEAYKVIAAEKVEDGKYRFIVPEGVKNVILVVVGDADGDGNVSLADKAALAKHLLPEGHEFYKELTALEIFALDLNGDGQLSMADKAILAKSLLPASHKFYTALNW